MKYGTPSYQKKKKFLISKVVTSSTCKFRNDTKKITILQIPYLRQLGNTANMFFYGL